jgi:hypothetical protein
MEIKGKVTFISELESGESQNGKWQKKEVEITENSGEYPNSIVLTAFNKGLDKLDGIQLNDIVTASFNSKVNVWKEKRFNSLNLWSIKKNGMENHTPQPGNKLEDIKNEVDFPEEENDDLPF